MWLRLSSIGFTAGADRALLTHENPTTRIKDSQSNIIFFIIFAPPDKFFVSPPFSSSFEPYHPLLEHCNGAE